jgi:type IV pilus assembly protein PilY1
MSMVQRRWSLPLAATVAMAWSGVSFAQIQSFGSGSLIIPMQSSFQTPCGSDAAYGLVIRLLKANQSGGYFDPATHPGHTPVTINWAINGSKNSPNRCIPTNLNSPSADHFGGANPILDVYSNPSSGYNDGCDFQIAGTVLQQPVTQVDYGCDPWTASCNAGSGFFPTVQVPMRTPGVICTDPYRTGGSGSNGANTWDEVLVTNPTGGDPACCVTTTHHHHHHGGTNCDCSGCPPPQPSGHSGACNPATGAGSPVIMGPPQDSTWTPGPPSNINGNGATPNTQVILWELTTPQPPPLNAPPSSQWTQVATTQSDPMGNFHFNNYTPNPANAQLTQPAPWCGAAQAAWSPGCNNTPYLLFYLPGGVCNGTSGLQYIGFQTPEAIPTYSAQTLTTAGGFTTIQYMGGAWVIDSTQAQEVIEYIEQGDTTNPNPALNTLVPVGAVGSVPAGTVDELAEYTGNNASGSRISYSQLAAGLGGDSYGSPAGYFDVCTGPLLTINGRRPNGSLPNTDHYVSMHQALVGFTANIVKRFNSVPPKIALVDTESNGDQTGSPSVSGLQILDAYLGNAGLYLVNSTPNHVDSGGCPTGTISGCSVNGGQAGFIYDKFDAEYDLMSIAGNPTGILNQTSSGKLVYGVLWTPHWEATNNFNYGGQYTGGATPSGVNGMNNIDTFLSTKGTGLMGECASIESYEGASNAQAAIDFPVTNFLFSNNVYINNLPQDDGNWDGRNCSNPDYPNDPQDACHVVSNNGNSSNCTPGNAPHQGGECMYWDNAFVPFAQIGDYHFVQTSGAVQDFKPDSTLAPASTYLPGTVRLATSWTNYHPGDYPNNPHGCGCGPGPAGITNLNCCAGYDIIDFGYVDSDPNQGTVVYVAGHDYQISTAATRIILDTLLNLGSNPVQTDHAMAAPTVYVDPNGATASGGGSVPGPTTLLFTPVYDVLSGAPVTRFTYLWSNGSTWLFPEYPGDIYEQSPLVNVGSVTALSVGVNVFNNGSVLWDARAILESQYDGNLSANPAGPSGRNLFTYLGGTIQSVGGAPNGLMQQGWVPTAISPEEVTDPSCIDVLQWGTVNDGKHPSYIGLVQGSDGICDIEEAVQMLAAPAAVSGPPWTNYQTAASAQANQDMIQGMLQVVQGWCFSTGGSDGSGHYTPQPNIGQCNYGPTAQNYPTLGGFVDGAPAVVGPSTNVLGDTRPTVAYAAGWDGEIHAFYVSGGETYAGPPSPLHYPNPSIASAFTATGGTSKTTGTDYATAFKHASLGTPPVPVMTELWAFMPASQLPLLSSNGQMLDTSPVVQDVFADFGVPQTGIREWHTVLVGSAGSPLGYTGSELFAIDVTNPLKPVLLWDVMGTWTGPIGTVSPIAVTNNPNQPAPSGVQIRYVQTALGAGYPIQGTTATGVYDYSLLGGTRGLAIGPERFGEEPVFPVYLTSNFNSDVHNMGPLPALPMNNGMQTIAIDLATGQKIWDWIQPYAPAPANVPSSIDVPQSVTLLPDVTGSIATVYAADFDGQLWELPAQTGLNNWSAVIPNAGVAKLGSIFTTGPLNSGTEAAGSAVNPAEPITTNVTIAKLPPGGFGAGATLTPWQGNVVALVGTDGSGDGFVDGRGYIHIINIDPSRRQGSGANTGVAPSDTASADTWTPSVPPAGQPGSLKPFPIQLGPNERAYGNITVSGTQVFFSTATVPVTNPGAIGSGTGNTYSVDLKNATSGYSLAANNLTSAYGPSQANYGGVAVLTDSTGVTHIIASQESQMVHMTTAANSTAVPVPQLTVSRAQSGLVYQVVGWLRRMLQ